MKTLNDISQYLGSIGRNVSGMSELNTVLLAWATDSFNPMGMLAASTDNAVTSSVFTLDFSRSYAGSSILNRFNDSDLGMGWDHNWNYKLTMESSGNVSLTGPHGSSRLFQPGISAGGTLSYTAAMHGDFGQLIRNADKSFTLTESDGTVFRFAVNGSLMQIVDANGNAVDLTYGGNGLLNTVADKLGNSLTLTWNANKKIDSVTDSCGDKTKYTYDSLGRVYETHYDDNLGSVS